MLDYWKQTTLAQFEAALAMLKGCLEQCPPNLWEEKLAALTFRQVAYHTLFFVDYYLSPGEEDFSLRDLHLVGGDEREPVNSPGLDQPATLAYVPICLEKLRTTLAAETEASLQQSSGFSWLPFTRGELHLYNLRHVQHHTGQLSAQLRRLDPACANREMLRWVRTGWR
jgi:hypothetical protein